ncbi:MAG TPA: hypothetical protein VMB71_12830 [Acetobacteraceae bacterium]|nr:hypothetical protein [Acetobacteraceae bacterium]
MAMLLIKVASGDGAGVEPIGPAYQSCRGGASLQVVRKSWR